VASLDEGFVDSGSEGEFDDMVFVGGMSSGKICHRSYCADFLLLTYLVRHGII
jgi:hypothetical protein